MRERGRLGCEVVMGVTWILVNVCVCVCMCEVVIGVTWDVGECVCVCEVVMVPAYSEK